MRNLFLLTINTLRITFRKKSSIFVYLILPVLLVVFVMNVYSSKDSKIKVGIYNQDVNGIIARDYVASLKNQDKFKIKEIKKKDIKDSVAESKVDCVVTIPENFDSSIYNGKIDKISITTIKGQESTAWIQSYTNYYMSSLSSMSKASKGDIETFYKIFGNYKNSKVQLQTNVVKDESEDKYKTVQSIGFLIMIMMGGASTTAGFILKEKKERTYYRIFTTPANNRIYIGANILANMCIMITQSIMVIFFSKYVFKLSMGVSDLKLLLVLLVFSLVCVTLGILIVSLSNTSSQASTMSTLITVPTCMLAGCFWPRDIMPDFMQKLAYLFPQTWTLETIKRLQDGDKLTKIIPLLIATIGFSVLFFIIGMLKMKSNDNANNFI